MAIDAPPRIFSPRRRGLAWRRALARQSGSEAARFVEDALVDDLVERIGFMRLDPLRALVIGEIGDRLATMLDARAAGPLDFDEEQPVGGAPYDFIASLGSLATVNDLPGALLHLRAALAPGGVVMASLIGSGSLANLRRAMIAAEPDRAAPRMHPVIDTRSATALLERAGFRRFVVDSWPIEVGYRSFDRVIGDLRDQGLGNVLATPAPALSRAAVARAREAFSAGADADGRVLETFEILTLTAWSS